jgi:beta-N-acetylhexosaminidase
MEMKAIAHHYGLEKSVPAAIAAGLDVLCFGNNLTYDPAIARKAVDILVCAVESGRLTEARIDVSYRRVLALKRQAGLLV